MRVRSHVRLAILLVAATATLGVATVQEPRVDDISAEALLERLDGAEPPLVLDVRTPEEFAEGHVPGALNIPHTEIADHLDRVREAGDVDIVVYCRSGRRAEIAWTELAGAGFTRLMHLTGDMQGWLEKELPTERPQG